MRDFATHQLARLPDVTAPDGSDVRVLLELSAGSLAHFELAAGCVSRAVVHRSVEEIWYILSGRGEMWRRRGREEVVGLSPGTCVSIPVHTRFQFRSFGPEPLQAVAVTMPPWPGEDEARAVRGPWEAVRSPTRRGA